MYSIGRATIAAASTAPSKRKRIEYPSQWPSHPRAPSAMMITYPTTVGGSTSGIMMNPSTILFPRNLRRDIKSASGTPTAIVSNVAADAIFKESQSDDQIGVIQDLGSGARSRAEANPFAVSTARALSEAR